MARYRSWIPKTAIERVVERHDDGSKKRAEYYFEAKFIGTREWHENGVLEFERPYTIEIKDGVHVTRQHGTQYEWYENGQLLAIEPYRNGLAHGTAKQWTYDGELLITYTMKHGNGLDFWCDTESGRLWEEWHHEGDFCLERRWSGDDKTIRCECYWACGDRHGIYREWNAQVRLRRGFPQYYVKGRKVTKRQYLKACDHDQTLPRFVARENLPRRSLPAEYVAQRKLRRKRPTL
jgi:hypothetical protein